MHGYHAISERTHRILNPFDESKLDLLAEIIGLGRDDSVLDLASGKGEMLSRFAAGHGITGTGVDVYEPLVVEARARAGELGVGRQVSFVLGEAASYARRAEPHTVVSCIGATWIGGGLAGTLALMRPLALPGGFLLVGECYRMPTGPAAPGADGPDLLGILDIVEASGCELVEMVLAEHADWDRYAASQWLNVARWLDENPDHPDAASVRATRDESRRTYLAHDRDHLGWGVFVLRPVPLREPAGAAHA